MRRLMYERLATGVPCVVPKPGGAFYYFLEVLADRDPMDVTERLIREHRVAVIPGSAFGAGGCTLRVSFGALDPAAAAEGASRLARGLRDIAGGA
jgi:aspartate/methionine/tyrosine aminotransferase